jgi:polyhydroxybutyrate depolymerase
VVDGSERDYLLTVPDAEGPLPLVIVLHGGFGSAEQARDSYGWDAVAAREGFAVAYPDGLGRAWNAGGGCCGRSGREGVDDVAFIESLVAELEDRLAIDADRIFVAGMSNGALMSYRLACDTDLFAAIGPVAGTMLGDCAGPAPVSVLHIHGDADTSVRMDGEQGGGPAAIDGPPVAGVIASWQAVDGCDPASASEANGVTTTIAECPDGRTVELVVVAGAGHQWPGSERVRPGAAEPSDALDATEALWAFFAAHQRA